MRKDRVPQIEDCGDMYYFDKDMDGLGCVDPIDCGRRDCTFGVYATKEEQARDMGYNPGCATCGAIGLSLVDAVTNDPEGEVPEDFKRAAAVELVSRNNLPPMYRDVHAETTLLGRLLLDGKTGVVQEIIRWAKIASDTRGS